MQLERLLQIFESLGFRLPRLATSTSRHCDTYQSPSRQTVAANGRFMTFILSYDAADAPAPPCYHQI